MGASGGLSRKFECHCWTLQLATKFGLALVARIMQHFGRGMSKDWFVP